METGAGRERRGLPRVAGHKAGIQPVRVTVETCAQLGLRALTLYAFSVENWKRPRAEVYTLWRLLRIYLRAELEEMQRHDIRFTAIGRLDEASRAGSRGAARGDRIDRERTAGCN